jgi:hypothetical protein
VWFDAERPQRLFESVDRVLDLVLGGGAAVAGLTVADKPLPNDRELLHDWS